jgi:YesN/AraC family two-component response regulator
VLEKRQKNTNWKYRTGIDKRLHAQLSFQRQNNFFHSNLHEKRIMYAIKEGDIDDLVAYLKYPSSEGIGTLSKNSALRNKKNLAICGITLATRAAIEGGMQLEQAYTMSDLYIQHVESLPEIVQIDQFVTAVFCEFAQHVLFQKQKKYSKAVTSCQYYIAQHLYDKCTVSDIAKIIGLNPIYLCQLFKKEVGISLREYIQQQKIEEAKRLLTSTSYSLTDIWTYLYFTDQSHFTKVFKRFAGITPKQYRNTY